MSFIFKYPHSSTATHTLTNGTNAAEQHTPAADVLPASAPEHEYKSKGLNIIIFLLSAAHPTRCQRESRCCCCCGCSAMWTGVFSKRSPPAPCGLRCSGIKMRETFEKLICPHASHPNTNTQTHKRACKGYVQPRRSQAPCNVRIDSRHKRSVDLPLNLNIKYSVNSPPNQHTHTHTQTHTHIRNGEEKKNTQR